MDEGKALTLAREQTQVEFGRVDIRQRMVPRIPSAKTRIKSSKSCELVVDDAEFLVMREVIDELA